MSNPLKPIEININLLEFDLDTDFTLFNISDDIHPFNYIDNVQCDEQDKIFVLIRDCLSTEDEQFNPQFESETDAAKSSQITKVEVTTLYIVNPDSTYNHEFIRALIPLYRAGDYSVVFALQNDDYSMYSTIVLRNELIISLIDYELHPNEKHTGKLKKPDTLKYLLAPDSPLRIKKSLQQKPKLLTNDLTSAKSDVSDLIETYSMLQGDGFLHYFATCVIDSYGSLIEHQSTLINMPIHCDYQGVEYFSHRLSYAYAFSSASVGNCYYNWQDLDIPTFLSILTELPDLVLSTHLYTALSQLSKLEAALQLFTAKNSEYYSEYLSKWLSKQSISLLVNLDSVLANPNNLLISLISLIEETRDCFYYPNKRENRYGWNQPLSIEFYTDNQYQNLGLSSQTESEIKLVPLNYERSGFLFYYIDEISKRGGQRTILEGTSVTFTTPILSETLIPYLEQLRDTLHKTESS